VSKSGLDVPARINPSTCSRHDLATLSQERLSAATATAVRPICAPSSSESSRSIPFAIAWGGALAHQGGSLRRDSADGADVPGAENGLVRGCPSLGRLVQTTSKLAERTNSIATIGLDDRLAERVVMPKHLANHGA
jgi:hypothetical protein